MNRYLNSIPLGENITNMSYLTNSSKTSSEKEMEGIAINIASLIANQLNM